MSKIILPIFFLCKFLDMYTIVQILGWLLGIPLKVEDTQGDSVYAQEIIA